MTQRPAPDVDQTGSFAPVFATASPVAFELTQEATIEADREIAESDAGEATTETSEKGNGNM
jgi:hypothetical protein